MAACLVLFACSTGASGATRGSSKGGDPPLAAECGLAAFDKAPKPVTINFWHAFVSSNNTWLVATINQFNNSQHDVHVNLLQFPSYQDLLTKYLAGLSTGDVPDVGEFEETTVQKLVDSNSTIPVQACIDASHYALTDYVKRALSYYSYRGVQESMPWAVSNVVLYYNTEDFIKAGLNPANPPATLQQVQQDAGNGLSPPARRSTALRYQSSPTISNISWPRAVVSWSTTTTAAPPGPQRPT